MKAAIVALVMLLASCAGVLDSARDTAADSVLAAIRDEQTLTAACNAAIDHAIDGIEVQSVLDRCDRAYDLYDALKRDMDRLLSALEREDEAAAVVAMADVARSQRAFAEAVAAMVDA